MSHVPAAATDYTGRRPKRSRGEKRRLAILEAVLRLIARDGVRGVRHRAVAAEAGVPLAATTYYFKDLTGLVTDAFLLFAERARAPVAVFQERSLALLEAAMQEEPADPEAGERLVSALTELSIEYLRSHTADRDSRLIERAFDDEAMRNPRLAEAVRRADAARRESIRALLAKVGTQRPAAEAQLVDALYLRLEFLAMLEPEEGLDWSEARAAIEQLARLLLGPSLGSARASRESTR